MMNAQMGCGLRDLISVRAYTFNSLLLFKSLICGFALEEQVWLTLLLLVVLMR